MRLYLGWVLRCAYYIVTGIAHCMRCTGTLRSKILRSHILHCYMLLQYYTQLQHLRSALRPCYWWLGLMSASELVLYMFSNAGKPWKSMTYEFNYREIFE